MSIGRRIELQIALLTVMGGFLLSLGGASPVLPICLLAAAVLATRQADGEPRFALPTAVVNVSIFVIALASVWRLAAAYGTREVILLGEAFGGLQVVLLFERRTARTRWDLFSLSLLAVFLSASLVQGPLYALALLAYCFYVLATLGLICLESARLRISGAGLEGRAAAVAGPVRGSWWRLLGIAASTTIVGPLALFLRFPEPAAARRDSSRPHESPEAGTREEVRADEPAAWQAVSSGADDAAAVGREFWWRTGRMTLSAFVVAVIVFCLAPRFGRIEFELPPLGDLPWQPGSPRPMRVVGFTDRVRLGEIGTMSEDQRLVLELQLMDHLGGKPYRSRGNLYLRGAILTRYRGGHWEFAEADAQASLRQLATQRPADLRALVRQRITVEPSAERDLFCIWPFLLLDDDPPLRFHSRTERIHRRRDMFERSFSYELVTTAFRDGVQSPWMPTEREIDASLHLAWPAELLPGLAGLAQRWIDESRIPAADPVARARWLESRFLNSGRFQYSLEATPRDVGTDPIEDFVIRHRQGHCEYFASALALMLRSQGIPSRLVVGFREDEYSELSGTYRVRQSHAHAWVEAYIPRKRLPKGAIREEGLFDWSYGVWLRLDPTPSFSARPTGVAGLTRQVENWFSLLHSFWRDNVLSMSGTRQREALYGPLVVQVRQAASSLADPGLGDAGGGQTLLGWIVWFVWCAGAVGCLLAAVFWLFRQKLPARWRGPLRMPAARRRLQASSSRPAVAFYQRLETLLARHGHVRAASQTPQEFADEAAKRIAAAGGDAQVSDWTKHVVKAFYEVRFGAGRLANDRVATVEAALHQLSRAARPAAQKPSPAVADRSAAGRRR